jgi:hypothetical protein
MILADSYRAKMAAIVAGGDLPDLTGIEQLNAPDLLKTVNQGIRDRGELLHQTVLIFHGGLSASRTAK